MYVNLAKWLWEQFGNDIKNFTKEKWGKFNWADAERKYREKLNEIHSTTRLLGHSKPINVDEIFTDVYVLDKQTAHRMFGLKNIPETDKDLEEDISRISALRLATTQKKLFILGKPGAGKTTFLKFLVLKACEGKINQTPIFISLKEWSDSEESLEQGLENYLIKQFEICSFPDAKEFINQLLKNGRALVLFDGLDEVKQEGNIRSKIIQLVNDFAKKYSNNQIFITCRVAAVEYSFNHFTYAEIADFDKRQTATFVKKWYRGQEKKAKRFLTELEKPENKGFLELTKTPLLLTLLCLAYDELLEFPSRRVDLYKESFDALLKKWDASRDIQRDVIYRGLSTLRKENLLSRIAYQNFKSGKFFFREEDITKQITDYLEQLPYEDTKQALPDGKAVLKSIEAQHGLIVERTYGIYSFSHLTFQEYLTARYIVQNAGTGTLDELVERINLDQWSEVVSISASLLDNADILFEKMYVGINKFTISSKKIMDLFEWLMMKSSTSANNRALLLLWQLLKEFRVYKKSAQALALTHTHSKELDEKISVRSKILSTISRCSLVIRLQNNYIQLVQQVENYLLSFDTDLAAISLDEIIASFEKAVHQEVDIGIEDKERYLKFPEDEYQNLIDYLNSTIVILKSLELATVSDRRELQEMILLPKYP